MVLTPAVPEVHEEDIQAAIDARTDSLPALRELGPPDLVHLIKQQNKSNPKQAGVYHHVTGIDASSSASLAAYIKTLTYSASDKANKIVSGLYCCYNAFSRLDMRVQVAIPGTVESYCIDERGEKKAASEDLWLEAYLCGILRAYSYADDGNGEAIKKIVGVRRFNPITSTEAEHKFLDAAERLFFNGWHLGSDPEIQVPNLVSNHLTTGLLNYIRTTGRYVSGINLFEKLRVKEPEISSLLAQVYLAADEEVKAVRLLYEETQQLPMDYSLLDCQADYCNNKGRPDLAIEVAKRSVISAPSEFGTWARLAEVYIKLEEWDLALLTLNSCPMFTYQDKDSPRMPEPYRVSLPIMPESVCDEVDDRPDPEEMEMVRPGLRKLHAAGFKGTFQKAYMLLTEILKKVSWDELLKIRSQVFVMEEEYRSEKHAGPYRGTESSRNASTVGLRGTSPQANGEENEASNEASESRVDDHKHDGEASTAKSNLGAESNGEKETDDEQAFSDAVRKPSHTVASEVVKAGGPDDPSGPKQSSTNASDSFAATDDANTPNATSDNTLATSTASYNHLQNKRLCERWLDNLFMVLYEDLRAYTIWRTEAAQYRQQQMQYKKSAEEWEILGELAERLHHPEDAVEAYEACLAMRFSPRAMKGVLTAHEANGDVRAVVDSLIRLVTWQYRWYSEFSPSLLHTTRRLIEEEGAVKIRSIIQATSLPQHVLNLTYEYTAVCANFRSSGSEG